MLKNAECIQFIRSNLHTDSKNGLISSMANLLAPRSTSLPPFLHVVQIGDPTLRQVSKPADIQRIQSAEIQKLINNMKIVLKKYDAFGISAPQLGMPVTIFALQCTKEQISGTDDSQVAQRGMVETPFKVFINPKVKIIGNYHTEEREGCCSMNQYSAIVPRHKELIVSGYNELGEHVNWHAQDWNARIVQHEMDHLKGSLFTDKMQPPESLAFDYWKLVNIREGDFRLSFGGYRGWRQYSYITPILIMIPILPLILILAK